MTIRLLGSTEILLEGQPLTNLGSRTAEALLIYLVCHETLLPHQELADLLWDDRDPTQVLANLRSILSCLRRELGDYLLSTRKMVGFDHDSDYWLDIAEFERILDSAKSSGQSPTSLNEDNLKVIQAALDLYRGDFLGSFPISQGHGFKEWAAGERERLRQLAATALKQLASYYFRLGDYQRARHQIKAILPRAYELEDGALISYCLQSLSLISGQEGNYNQALRQAEKAVETGASYSYPDHYQFLSYRIVGNLALAAGDLNRSAEAHEKAYSLALAVESYDEAAPIYELAMGRLAHRRGDLEVARGHFAQALSLSRKKEWPAEFSTCLIAFGDVLVDLGDYETAGQLLDEAEQLATAMGDSHLLALLDRVRGRHAEGLDDLDGACSFYQKSLASFQQNRNLAERPMALAHLGRVLVLLDDYKVADSHLWQALTAFQDQGHLGGLAFAHIGLGLLKRKERAFEAAGAHTEAALEAALAAGEIYFALQALIERAFFLATGGFKTESLSLLFFAQNHPATTAHNKNQAVRLASTLENNLPQPLLDSCRDWAVGKSLEEAVNILP